MHLRKRFLQCAHAQAGLVIITFAMELSGLFGIHFNADFKALFLAPVLQQTVVGNLFNRLFVVVILSVNAVLFCIYGNGRNYTVHIRKGFLCA